MSRLIKFVVLDIVKNKFVLIYTFFLSLLSWSVFGLEDNSSKGLLTLLNVILLTVPLISIIFSTIYIYSRAEFVELLVSQPIKRKKIWLSLFLGLSISLIFSFIIGAGIPILMNVPTKIGLMMVSMGCIISLIFVSIAFMSSIITRDKAKGIGFSILSWLYFAILFDGLVFFLLFQLSEYPIEKAMVGIIAFNPIDLARILILLQLDVSALMGYSGAIFKNYFGSFSGIIITAVLLLLWIIIPFWISMLRFNKKDL